MRRRIQVAVVLVLGLVVGGVILVAIRRVRHHANEMLCVHHLKHLNMAVLNYHETHEHFPMGTVPNTTLPPERRLGWLVDICFTYIESHPQLQFDKAKAWDAEENCPPYCFFQKDKYDRDSPKIKEVIRDIKVLLCPANPARNGPLFPCPTHYVGVAGVGSDAARLPTSDRRAGVFGYDRKVSLADIADGISTTMVLAEVTDGGPWTAGGRATVRGLGSAGPYLGDGGQFASFHRRSDSFDWSPPIVTNVAFADGSVRRLTAAISPELFEAIATIAGGEEIGIIPEW